MVKHKKKAKTKTESSESSKLPDVVSFLPRHTRKVKLCHRPLCLSSTIYFRNIHTSPGKSTMRSEMSHTYTPASQPTPLLDSSRKEINITHSVNPLSANPTKWSNTLNQFVGKFPTNCLSVFDYFVKLALKELKRSGFTTTEQHQTTEHGKY